MPDNKLFVGHEIRVDKYYYALNPLPLAEQLSALGLPISKFLNKANSYVMPRGRHPGVGHVLMYYRDLKAIEDTDKYNQFRHSLTFFDDYKRGVEITNLTLSRSQAITGLASRGIEETVYLAEFADARCIAHYSAVDRVYNVRTYQYLTLSNTPDFFSHSLNSGSPWSWDEMVRDLWSYLPTDMGVAVTLNAAWPTAIPENFQFRGMNAWDAICSILDYTGHTIYPDLGGNFTIAPKGKLQGISAVEANLRSRGFVRDPSWDFPSNRRQSLGIPEKVTVYFHTAYHAFQNVTGDANSRVVTGKDAWLSKPLEKREYDSPTFFTDLVPIAETNVAIHDNLCAYYDEMGALLNGTELTQRAKDVAEGYLMSKNYGALPTLHSVYLGYHPDILAGPEVEAVCWFERGNGSRTEILLSPLHYSPKDELMGLGQHYVNATLAWESEGPPDVARHHEPTDRMALAQVYGDDIDPEGTGEAYVLYGQHTTDSPISWSVSTKLIKIHNPWKVKIPEGTRVMIFWHLQTRRWICAFPKIGVNLYMGTMQADTCPTDKAIPQDYKLRDVTNCKDITPVYEVSNTLQLAARNTDKFIAFWNCDLNNGDGGYDLLQVQHHAEEYVRADFENVSGCEPELDEYGNPTGRTIPTFQCKVKYSKREINVQYCKDPSQNLTLINAELRYLMSDWWVDGKYIKGKFEPVYVLCPCDNYDEILHIGADCAGGSGSGSGSGGG